jgi:hypothetical protein
MELVRLTTCADGFEARLVAARLGSEGIVWSLRGGHDGPLALGAVDVLVDADDYALARALLAAEPDWDGEVGPADARPERETTGRDVLLGVAILLAAVLFLVARIAGPL